MDNNTNKKTEDVTVAVLYKMGLLILIPAIAVFLFLRTDIAVNLLLNGGYHCGIKARTGLNCPGCGGTRASFCLSRGDFLGAFRLNAVVPVSLILYAYFMIRQTCHKLFNTKSLKEKDFYILLGIFIGTVVIKTIVSNIYNLI